MTCLKGFLLTLSMPVFLKKVVRIFKNNFHKSFMASRIFCCMNIWTCNISKERTDPLLLENNSPVLF